jgi:hypothetical protein
MMIMANANFFMAILPIESLTMLPMIETEQANKGWPSTLAMRADSPLLVNRHI